ncbi:MAG: purine-nucleoside phosphorylase [Bdellovibrionales bacterium]|nr:purine-nucleoside phosphorylase [Bdellovibrionales bacterium]
MTMTLDHIHHDLEFLQEKFGSESPDCAIILGSGMGGFTNRLENAKSVIYSDIPHFPPPGVAGHKGECYYGTLGKRKVLVFSGRFHFYEGHNMDIVTLPVRICGIWKIKNLVVTNAAGGIREDLVPGSLMFIQDHLNFTGGNPLRGPNLTEFGDRFADMTEAYNEKFLSHGLALAKKQGLKATQGVYLGVTGPSYETPAEIRAFKSLGADAVGMSTVPEVITARQQGMNILGLSLIVNYASGISASQKKIDHDKVITQSQSTEESFCKLLSEWVKTVDLE